VSVREGGLTFVVERQGYKLPQILPHWTLTNAPCNGTKLALSSNLCGLGQMCRLLVYMLIASVVIYGYRTWPVIHKAEHNAKLSENKVLQILDLAGIQE